MRKSLIVAAAFVALGVPPAGAETGSQWGRDLENRNRVSLGFSAGSVLTVDGSVRETVRPIYQITGLPSTETPSYYSMDQLGLSKSYATYGLTFESMWKYATLQLRGHYFNPTSKRAADQDYYLAVESVSYNGQDYDHMMIPKGREYDANVDAGQAELRLLITPFTLEAPGLPIEWVPSIYLGLAGAVFSYDIDAGPAEGTIQYENPPFDYVVGGHGKGWNGVAVPEIGLGTEFILWQTTRRERDFTLSLKGYYSILQYEGTTEELGIDAETDKTLDLDYVSYDVSLEMNIPMSKTVDFFLALTYQYLKADAYVQAKERPVEEALALREKFNKQIYLEISMLTASAGFRF